MRSTRRGENATAIDLKRLARAIALRDQSYKLLRWIGDALSGSRIPPYRVAQHSGGAAAATDWLRSHYHDLPERLRPDPSDIDEFAAFFSTYLTSSFDVVRTAGARGVGPAPWWCGCDVCVAINHARQLRPKKLYARDKRRAEWLMVEAVRRVGRESGIVIDGQDAAAIVADASTRRYAAYVTYCEWLVRRLSGESDGPAILALWRLIAWDPRGGVRRGFRLEPEDAAIAEAELLAAMRARAARGPG